MGDCNRDSFPKAACAVRVRGCREIAPAIFELVVGREPLTGAVSALPASPSLVPAPLPGQFFMLRSRPSGVLLGRPISVYRADAQTITFLILKKGRGTAELCELKSGDSLDLVGPIGNHFTLPDAVETESVVVARSRGPLRVAIVGGGIGVAPVAGFALGLAPRSFDFYASFRSAPYALDGLEAHARRLVVTTEDGSAGVKGMLPAVFDAAAYDLVYACGPTPMLSYVQLACASADTAAFLSLEQRMACGSGACLGCSVRTRSGNRRCCVDGPIFEGAEVIL